MTGDGDQIHATCVAVGDVGVLLRGASGAGKSDLALRLIDELGRLGGAQLVADDRVDLRVEHGHVWAQAPAALAGLLEVRGLGIISVAYRPRAAVGLIVDLVAGKSVERLPARRETEILGRALPRMALAPFHTSAPAVVRAAVAALPWDMGLQDDITGGASGREKAQ